MSPLRHRARGTCRTPVLLGAALGLLVPLVVEAAAPAPGQEEQRRKQLEVLEEILSDNVRDYVNERVSAEIREDADETGSSADRASMVVRVGSISRAHGVFIDGYGVIFSIQIPQVGVLPRHFVNYLPFGRIEGPSRWEHRASETDEHAQRVTARMVAGRTQSMEQQLRSLETLLRRQLEEGGGNEVVRRQLAQIEELRARFDSLSDGIAAVDEPANREAEASEPEPSEVEAAELEPSELEPTEAADTETDGTGEAEAPSPRQPEAAGLRARGLLGSQLQVSRLLEESRQRTAQAVADAAVETLAGFGTVIKGLDADHRISVVVIPAAAPFTREHQRGQGREEFVVSVRYGDIRDLDDGHIDGDEFLSRVQVHNRLGTAISLEPDEQ